MEAIRIQKIDGQEFVTLTDYLRLKEEKEKMLEEIKILKQSIMQDEWGIIPKLEEENKKLKERFKKLDDQTPKLEKHLTLLYRLIKYWRGKYERYKKEMVPYLFCKTDCYPKFRPEDYGLVGKDGKLVLIEDVNF